MTQADFPLRGAQLDDFELHLLAQPEPIFDVCSIGLFEFGNVTQAFDAFI